MEVIKKLSTRKITAEMNKIMKDLKSDKKNVLRSNGSHIIEGIDPDLIIPVKNKRGPSYSVYPATSIQELGNQFLELFPDETNVKEESFLWEHLYTPPLDIADALGILNYLGKFCIDGIPEFDVSNLYSNPNYEHYTNSRRFVSVFLNLVAHGKFFIDESRNDRGHDPRELLKNFYICLWNRTEILLRDLESGWQEECAGRIQLPAPKSPWGDYTID